MIDPFMSYDFDDMVMGGSLLEAKARHPSNQPTNQTTNKPTTKVVQTQYEKDNVHLWYNLVEQVGEVRANEIIQQVATDYYRTLKEEFYYASKFTYFKVPFKQRALRNRRRHLEQVSFSYGTDAYKLGSILIEDMRVDNGAGMLYSLFKE